MKIYPYPEELRFYEKIVAPEGVEECSMEIDGWTRTWKQYIPSSWTADKQVPLVISMHGGDEHNAEYRTGWVPVAEREGFIALFPECIRNGETWNTWNTYTREDGKPDEMVYLDALIAYIVEKYNIDKTRIYMHGQSMGDSMTTWYTFERGYMFAAAAPFSGHTPPSRFVGEDGSIITAPKYQLPVLRTHGSEDVFLIIGAKNIPTADPSKRASKSPAITDMDPANTTDAQRLEQIELFHLLQTKVWKDVNCCEELPEITVRGRYALYRFKGDTCDFGYYTVNRGYHGTFIDMADYIWCYFFSAFARIDGKIVRTLPKKTFMPDKGAVALADGAKSAYVDNKRVELEEGQIRFVDGAALVPAKAMEKLFPGVKVEMIFDGLGAEISYGADVIQVAQNNRVAVFNEKLVNFERTRYIDGVLYVPAADIAERLLGLKAAAGYDACYINSNGGEMSFDLAYVIKAVLGTHKLPTPLEMLAMEKAYSKD